ncbi:Multidrug resistance-associated protein 1 [Podila epicladia]|nr:Multidrug resistance-associated protein 1 [Podila epicladia]
MLVGAFALIARLALEKDHLSELEIIATGSMAAAWVLAAILNHFEHNYQIRSSDSILGYFLATIASMGIYLQSTLPRTPSRKYPLTPLEIYFIALCAGCLIEAWPRGHTTVQQRSGASIFEKSNLFSRLSFHYIQRIMSRGYKRPLQLEDVAHLMPERIRSDNAYRTLSGVWYKEEAQFRALSTYQQDKKRPWLLLKTIAKTYGYTGWAPILICRVVATTLVSVTSAQLSQQAAERGMEIRSGLAGLVYRKALRLSPMARQQSSTGELSNHMSVDSEKWASSALNTLPQWVSAPIEVVLALTMLYHQLGWCALVGLFTILGLLPIQNKVSGVFTDIKERKLEAMDSRIRLVTEMFTGIKAIKMYGWEDAFKAKIDGYRQIEMAVLRRFGIVYAGMTLIFSTTMIMSLLSFGIYATVGGPGGQPGVITPHVIFVSLSLFGLLSKPISTMDHLLSDTTSVFVATRRIQKFLLAEELQRSAVDQDDEEQHWHSRQRFSISRQPASPAITIKNGEFSWRNKDLSNNQPSTEETPLLLNNESSSTANSEFKPTLHDINFSLKQGSLTAVVGRVGQGKSSLISALIGEMYRDQGSVQLEGSVALVTQQAWIMNGTVRDNILFGRVLDQRWYERVIDVCCLAQDIEILPARDQTEIGERGINLSGGQKQRVSLARAAYQNADIYLLDDPLSAVDAHVEQHLWQKLIGPHGLLKNKTRLLVTHAIHHLEEADQIVVMKDGTISEMGSLVELVARRQGFYELQREFVSTERAKSKKRPVSGEGTKETAEKENNGQSKAESTPTGGLVTAEKMVSGTVDWAMFRIYAQSAGYRNIALIVVFYILVEVAQVGTGFWLQYWSEPLGQAAYTVAQFLLVYAGLTAAYMGFNMVLFYISNVQAAILAARHLHDSVGRIINRFSTDVDACDESIIWNIIDVVYCLVAIAGTLVVISVSTPLFLLAVPPLVLAYSAIQSYFIQSSQALKRFMSVSKSPLYQHFGETLAGVSTIRAMHVTPRFVSMHNQRADCAAETALAFGIANRWLKIRIEFLGSLIVLAAALLAVHSRGNLGAGAVGLSLTYAMAITVDIAYLVRSFSELQHQLISVERIEEYATLRQEAPAVTGVSVPSGWPAQGKVVFRNYSARYREGLDLVLKDVSFGVQPSEKVGIVGRTGAGKSSLTLALFRMIEAADSYWARASGSNDTLLEESRPLVELSTNGALATALGGGSIEVDGVDIATLGLKDLRQHLAVIPQDTMLFSGTLRENLDPFQEAKDVDLWQALERAHLKTFVGSLPGGLSFEVAQSGENFSVGQRALVCLARAMLRKTKILVLDEATAAVDVETDELIQKTIRSEFADRTILTIAHRIKTVMDSDKILVLDEGRVKEFGAPSELLAKKHKSVFYELALRAGELHRT